MASQWYCFTDTEEGPYTFQQLAERIARQELRPTDLVRRKESQEWQQVDSVLGLMRASRQALVHAARSKSAKSGGVLGHRLIKFSERLIPGASGQTVLLTLSCCMMAFCGLELLWMWWSQPVRFPRQPDGGVVVEAASKLQQMRPLPPLRPTIAELKPGVPQIVPGFETVSWLKSPSLSADLLTIVYVTYLGPQQLDDLMIAERKSINEPFQNHRPLRGINTSEREAHPTLSSQGTELIFVQLGEPSRLRYASRADSLAEFTSARDLKLTGKLDASQHLDAPQFITEKLVHVTSGDSQFQQRTHWMATRLDRGEFSLGSQMVLQNPWPRPFFTNLGRRAFIPGEDGLQVTVYSAQRKQFEEPELLLGTELVGPGLTSQDDTIWVSPAEDLIFFCSPGLGNENSPDRKLWMIRH